MKFLTILLIASTCLLLIGCNTDNESNSLPTEISEKLYIVQLSLGINWDTSKEAHLQSGFQAHVNNMKKLRESGSLLIGARYSDFGMLIIKAGSISEVQTMMQNDPMISDSLFTAEFNEFNTFYDGCTSINQ